MGEATASYDIVILGGGPAGAAAAIELARHGHAVLVLERTRYDNVRIGETLPPQATQWLGQLGILDAFESVPHCVAPGLVSLWDQDAPAEEPFRFNSYSNGWHLDRVCFDTALAEAAERAGAVVCRSAVVRSCGRSNDDSWRVGVDVDSNRKEIDTRWLFDATGRNGWFIRRQGVRPRVLDRLIGLLAYVDPRASSDQRLFIEARPDGWWYSAPLPGERSIAAFMTDKDLIPHEQGALKLFWEEQRASSRMISWLHGKPSAEIPLRVVAANSTWSGTVAGPQWFAIGDAAMAHDPLFGLGICHALGSGWTAARALIASSNGDSGAIARYQGWAESCYRDYLDRRASIYSAVTQWSNSKFWNRRARPATSERAPG
jgi:flavin-dependent dehydrogenase